MLFSVGRHKIPGLRVAAEAEKAQIFRRLMLLDPEAAGGCYTGTRSRARGPPGPGAHTSPSPFPSSSAVGTHKHGALEAHAHGDQVAQAVDVKFGYRFSGFVQLCPRNVFQPVPFGTG